MRSRPTRAVAWLGATVLTGAALAPVADHRPIAISTPVTAAAIAVLSTAASPGADEARPMLDVIGDRGPGMIVDPVPLGYSGAFAYVNPSDSYDQSSDWLEVWAEPGATRANGRWFAMHVKPYGDFSSDWSEPTLERIELGGRLALAETADDGLREISTMLDEQASVHVASNGFSDSELAAILGATTRVDATGQVSFGPAAADLIDGMDLLLSRRSWFGTLHTPIAEPLRSSGYGRPRGEGYVTIDTGRPLPNDLVVTALLNPRPPVLGDGDPGLLRWIDIGGRRALHGTTAYDEQFLMWHDGAETITVRGAVSLELLVTMASATRRATNAEWEALERASAELDSSSSEIYTEPTFTEVSTITTASGSTWVVNVSGETAADNGGPWVTIEQRADNGLSNGSQWVQYDPAHPLTQYTLLDAVVIVAVVDTDATLTGLPGVSTASTTPTTLRVTTEFGVVDMPLVDVESSRLVGAAFAFSELSDYTAQLLDDSGNVLASLDE